MKYPQILKVVICNCWGLVYILFVFCEFYKLDKIHIVCTIAFNSNAYKSRKRPVINEALEPIAQLQMRNFQLFSFLSFSTKIKKFYFICRYFSIYH